MKKIILSFVIMFLLCPVQNASAGNLLDWYINRNKSQTKEAPKPAEGQAAGGAEKKEENRNVVPPPPPAQQPVLKAGQTAWSDPAADSCEDYDTAVSIGAFEDIPQSVRKEWLIKVAKGLKTAHVFAQGQEFGQLMGCNYKVRKDVVVAWAPTDKDKAGEKYRSYSDGHQYYLVRSIEYNKWLVWKVKAKKKAAAKKAPQGGFMVPDFETPAPAQPTEPEATGFQVDDLVFDEEEPAAETTVFDGPIFGSAPPDPTPASLDGPYKVNFDISLFGGYAEKTQGVGDGRFKGIDATFYPVHAGSFDFGLTAKYVDWKNKDFDFGRIDWANWRGNLLTYGLAAKHRGNFSEQILKVSIGEKENKYSVGGYRNKEEADLLVLDFYSTWWFNRTFVNTIEIGGFYEGVRKSSKVATFNGAPVIGDGVSDQRVVSAKIRTEVYRHNKNLALVVGLGWQEYGEDTDVRIGEAGLKYNVSKAFEVYGGAETRSPQGGDNSVGGVLSVNIKF